LLDGGFGVVTSLRTFGGVEMCGRDNCDDVDVMCELKFDLIVK